MTGMKEGAGEDPFAEDESGRDRATDEDDDRSGETGTDDADRSVDVEGPRQETAKREGLDDGRRGSTASAGGDTEGPGSRTDSRQQMMEIPYKLRRDSVQDGRNRVPLFLQSETKGAERDALRELEDRFDDDVSLTDLREALILVGLERLDEVEGQLEQWGYGMTFEV